MPLRLLILGGTTEASRLAEALAGDPTVEATVSLAGRTALPRLPALPVRIGGFGGIDGLVHYLRREQVGAVVDATHPFAIRIAAHAAAACARLGLPLAVFSRPPWTPRPGERWTAVPDLQAAVAALGTAPRTVFVTTGRLGLAAYRAAPQHHYLIRSVDPPEPGDLPPHHRLILARGPFDLADETALMRGAGIDVVVTKNSGGAAGRAKLDAAHALGLPVILVERGPGGTPCITDLPAVLAWIKDHRPAP